MNCENKLRMTKKKAFTLIELLIVIAIIGILFIVLISKVNFATDKAKASGVQTDFRSFQLAFETVAREQSGFSNLVNEDYEQLEKAINQNLDNKLKIDIDADGTITMANGATDPWDVEYHGQYVTGDDGKDCGAIVMYSNGADLTFGSTAVVVNGVVSINTTDESGNDDYSLAIIYSLNGGAGRIDTSTTGFSNNLTASDGTPGENAPDYDNEALVFKLLAGIYEPGAIDVCKKEGLEAAQDMMIMSWEDMVANEYVYVYDGDVCSGYVCANYDYYDMFNGDLIFPADGSVLVIDVEAFPGMNLTGVSIPSNIVCINDFAFCETTLNTVCFAPNSQLEYIGYASFAACLYLENVVIPDNVKYIGESAFAACESLTSVTINDNLEEMGYASFYGCTSLESITLPFTGMYKGGSPESEAYNNLFGYIFGTEYYEGGVMTRQFWQSISEWIDVCIPSSLKTVTITGNKVSSYAFCGCNFENVIIGDDVEIIETAAFFGGFDGGFTNITIGTNVKIAEDGAFMVGIENLYVNNLAGYCGIEFGYSAFPTGCNLYVNNQHVVDLIIPNGVTKINDNTFRYFLINSVTIPSSVTSIGRWAFSDSNITSVYISDLAAWCNMESNFSRTDSIKLYLNGKEITGDIVLPDGIERIGNYTFQGCDKITSITIPSSVTSIGEDAFYHCTNLMSVILGDGVMSIGSDAFYGCYKLVEVINKSSLNIEKGSSSNGRVSYYALEIHNGESKIVNKYGYLFYTCDGVYYLVNYIGKATELTLPKNYNGENYVINRYTFYNNDIITNVTIPNGVTSIVNNAFAGCTSLVNITIPFVGARADATGYESHFGYIFGYSCRSSGSSSYHYYDSSTKYYYAYNIPTSLTKVAITGGSIGEKAFDRCRGLVSVTIGNNVTSIGEWAFANCTGLEEIHFNATAMNDLSSNNYIFCNVGTTGDGIKVFIGANVTKIPAYLFYPENNDDVPQIISVEFEENSVCESIGSYAFYDADYITSINLPASITTIGTYAFATCSSLTSITLPENLKTVEKYAFSGCGAVTQIEFNAIAMDDLSSFNYVFYNAGFSRAGIKVFIGANVTKIPSYLFDPAKSENVPKIISVEFEDGSACTSIGDNAFNDCTSLTSVELPAALVTIGEYAFACTSITSVTIPDNVTIIDNFAFDRCSNLTTVEFGANSKLQSIGGWAFYDCTKLTNIIIPDSVTSIGSYAFNNCDGLTSVVIPDGVTSLGTFAFYSCGGLTSVVIGNGIATLEKCVFDGCTSLTSVIIPDSVTTIGYYAFSGCTGIKNVIIGNGVTDIKSHAFEDCTNLISITITASSVAKCHGSFDRTDSLTAIYVNSDLVDKYKKADGWRDLADKIQAIPTT